MGTQVQLSASAQLLSGPQACDDAGFPSTVSTTPLALNPCDKPYVVTSGVQLANVASASSPSALSMGEVTQAHTLYLRSATAMAVSVTYGSGSAQVLKVLGLLLHEVDSANPITALAIQGSGTVEYAVYGNA